MKNTLNGIKEKLLTNYYEKNRLQIIFDMNRLQEIVNKTKNKNLECEAGAVYIELVILRNKLFKEAE